jgi:formylglycine-generating enzyme required for sulfatase activity
MKRLFIAFFVLCAAQGLWGCSESGKKTPPSPPAAPEIRLFYPPDVASAPFVVSDSVDVYVGALAPQGESPLTMEFLFSHPNRSTPDKIGDVSDPISLAEVPEEIRGYIQLPEGWNLYKRRWYTGPIPPAPIGTPINTGTYVQVFAVAADPGGGEARSDLVRVRILNEGDNLEPPTPSFVISPSSGTTADVFTFDPTTTSDLIDPNSAIQVRWNFDGGAWDIDWSANAHADQKQTWRYARASSYTVILQARNSYLPDSIAQVPRSLGVSPTGGRAHHPDSLDFVQIPPGTYTIGATEYQMDGHTYLADSLEYSRIPDPENPDGYIRYRHNAILTQAVRVLKYEVTNQQYLAYLVPALQANKITYEPGRGAIVYHGPDPAEPDGPVFTWVCLELDRDRTRIEYDQETRTFRIAAGYENHPVTGVTWRGAYMYCNEYGVRLPTEAEWEIAARGTHDDYAFPFGVTLDSETAGRWANFAGSGDPQEHSGNTTPVMFYDGGVHDGFQTENSASAFGLWDMAGNVAEWTGDWLAAYGTDDERDPSGPLFGEYKVVRGGSYQDSPVGIRCTARKGERNLETSFASIGFRCAYLVIPGQ